MFGIEARAEQQARELKRKLIKEEIESSGRGYEGNTRVCPKCGRPTQRYKGDRERTLRFECGDFRIARAKYLRENKLPNILLCSGVNLIVPIAMKLVPFDDALGQFVV